jgi:hypothetical protein
MLYNMFFVAQNVEEIEGSLKKNRIPAGNPVHALPLRVKFFPAMPGGTAVFIL